MKNFKVNIMAYSAGIIWGILDQVIFGLLTKWLFSVFKGWLDRVVFVAIMILVVGFITSFVFAYIMDKVNDFLNKKNTSKFEVEYDFEIFIGLVLSYILLGNKILYFICRTGLASNIFMLFLMIAFRMNILAARGETCEDSKKQKIKATTWDFGGYKETTYRDEYGNKVGEATSFDWGPVIDTTIKDEKGNETKIEHWKFK